MIEINVVEIMQVSISLDGERGGIGQRCRAASECFLQFFLSNSRPLGLKNSSNLIKYPHLGITLNGVMSCIKTNEVI